VRTCVIEEEQELDALLHETLRRVLRSCKALDAKRRKLEGGIVKNS